MPYSLLANRLRGRQIHPFHHRPRSFRHGPEPLRPLRPPEAMPRAHHPPVAMPTALRTPRAHQSVTVAAMAAHAPTPDARVS